MLDFETYLLIYMMKWLLFTYIIPFTAFLLRYCQFKIKINGYFHLLKTWLYKLTYFLVLLFELCLKCLIIDAWMLAWCFFSVHNSWNSMFHILIKFQCCVLQFHPLGDCTCNTGYYGDDCSINLSTPPSVEEIPDFLCDLLKSDCRTVVVNGDGFLQIDSLVWRVQKLVSA